MLTDDLMRGAKSAAAYLGSNPRMIYYMVASGQLPCIRKGRAIYFRKSELDAAFRSQAAS